MFQGHECLREITNPSKIVEVALVFVASSDVFTGCFVEWFLMTVFVRLSQGFGLWSNFGKVTKKLQEAVKAAAVQYGPAPNVEIMEMLWANHFLTRCTDHTHI